MSRRFGSLRDPVVAEELGLLEDGIPCLADPGRFCAGGIRPTTTMVVTPTTITTATAEAHTPAT